MLRGGWLHATERPCEVEHSEERHSEKGLHLFSCGCPSIDGRETRNVSAFVESLIYLFFFLVAIVILCFMQLYSLSFLLAG